ncbi:MAG TPA: hypothetical protein VFE65_04215 [Pseudonocardia sp.]|jgi:hypothetical protein|nr:hypothetical protein [Pseudonocardia sp.]
MPVGFESVRGTGAMINWLTVVDADVDVFEDWYDFEHIPERVSVPGFLRARPSWPPDRTIRAARTS